MDKLPAGRENRGGFLHRIVINVLVALTTISTFFGSTKLVHADNTNNTIKAAEREDNEDKRFTNREFKDEIKDRSSHREQSETEKEAGPTIINSIKTGTNMENIIGSTFTLPGGIELASSVYGEGPFGNSDALMNGKPVESVVITAIDATDPDSGKRATLAADKSSPNDFVKFAREHQDYNIYFTISLEGDIIGRMSYDQIKGVFTHNDDRTDESKLGNGRD